MRIDVIEEATDDVIAAIRRLAGILSRSGRIPAANEVEAVVKAEANTVFVARNDDGLVVGMLTLVVFPLPSGRRAWIEDVVVDPIERRRGIGEALTLAAIEYARGSGATTVDLTSGQDRPDANRLYERIGFERRGTGVYRYGLAEGSANHCAKM